MSAVAPVLTADDLDHFPNDGLRRELIEGVLYVAAAPWLVHQEVSARLNEYLRHLVIPNNLGHVVYAPIDVRFSPYDLVQPDLVFVRTERLGICRGNTIHGAPDIVIEILSPTNSAYDLTEKLRLYERFLVPEYWIVDPVAFGVTQLVRVEGRFVQAAPIDGVSRSSVLPDLVIDPAVLFAGLDAW